MADAALRYDDLLDPEFQVLILAKLGRDQDFLARARPIVKPDYFRATVHHALCASLFTYWDQYHALPLPAVWQIAAIQAGDAAGLPRSQVESALTMVLQTPEEALPRDFLAERAVYFAQRAEGALAIGRAADALREFPLEDLQRELHRILDFPARFLQLGSDLRTQWAEALVVDEREIFRTGYPGLDSAMRGGSRGGELVGIAAHTKVGKTTKLVNVATRMMQLGEHVLYYTLEMYPKDILRRGLSILSGIPTNALPHDPTPNLVRAMDALHEYTPGSLIVKDFPPASITVEEIEAHAAQVEQTTGHRHVVVLDYADLLRWRGDEWQALFEIYQHLRALAARHRVPVWTASQTNAEGQLAGSKRKAFVVDWLFEITQTPIDYGLNRYEMTLKFGRHDRKSTKTFWFVNYQTGQIEEVSIDRYQARAQGLPPGKAA
jgi:KaiC/GvpD/RAD55 family RecA-like ATPase